MSTSMHVELTPLDLDTALVVLAARLERLQHGTLMYTAPSEVVLTEAIDREGGRAAYLTKSRY